MPQIKHFLQTWKHDIMAGSLAVLGMVLLLQQMSGGLTSVAAVTPIAASPASFGIVTETTDAPDALARTGETNEQAQAEPQPAEDEHKPPNEQAAQELAQTVESQQEQPPLEASETVSQEIDTAVANTEVAPTAVERMENPTTPPETTAQPTEQVDHEVAKDEPPPQPNDVEDEPKPFEQMTAQDIAEAVAAYEQHVRDGEVRLVLHWALSSEQLNSVVAYYVVSTKNTMISVNPRAQVEYITDIPKGKLIGDLPLDRNKWPSFVGSLARHHLGSNYIAKDANFVLSDPTALRMYRTLASDVGTKDWQPGSVFILQIFTSAGQIQVKLVGRNSSTVGREPTVVAAAIPAGR